MSYAELWASMGLFAKGIVFVMFVMSAWSWAVSISKFLYLRKSQKETRKFAPEFSAIYRKSSSTARSPGGTEQEEPRRACIG